MDTILDTAPAENKEARRNIERDYDVLKGALVGLSTNDWAKSVLMRCLDKLYEAALTGLDSPSTSGPSKASAA